MLLLNNLIIVPASFFLGTLLGIYFSQSSTTSYSKREKEKREYAEIAVLQELTRNLGLNLEMRPAIEQIIQALRKLFPQMTIAYLIDPLGLPTVSKQAYIYAQKGVGKRYLASLEKSLGESLRKLPDVRSKIRLQEWQLKRFYFEFLERKQDKESPLTPLSMVNIPIIVSGSIVGLINLSSAKLDALNQKQQEIIYTIADSAGQTIERLKALVASEQSRLADLVESMTNGVLMFNKEKQVIVANPVIRKIAHWQNEKAPLVKFLTLFDQKKPPSEAANLFADVEEVLQRGIMKRVREISLGNQVFEMFIVPVRNPQKQVSGGAMILHDITELKEIARMKTEFLSVAAHQLRSPLGVMRWNLEMLLAGDMGKVPNEVKVTLQQVHDNNQRMIILVNDLLNVSRIEEGRVRDEPSPSDIIAIIKKSIAEIKPKAIEKSVEIELKTQEQLPQITIDPKRFHEVICNLLSNAIKYNHPGGKVTIEIKKTQKLVEIKVTDTGMGIPERDQDRVFSKFFRATNAIKSETEGSGLGLFVVKSYVEAWGGEVSFESQLKKGSNFTVIIPLKPKQHVLGKNLPSRPQQIENEE